MSDEQKPDVLQDRITVKVRGEEYVFRVPSIRYDIETAYRSAAIRRKADPAGAGGTWGVDPVALNTSWALATIELYLEAGPQWAFSSNAAGKPIVDHEKFPVNKYATALEVANAFQAAYDRFRDDGTGDVDAARA
jgi:hypothetical protein